ncbi:hypothetical protein A7982_12662 [Minicystis rosea]|nr:hypothetical protein A7982_12662 [Minicystis rosea]
MITPTRNPALFRTFIAILHCGRDVIPSDTSTRTTSQAHRTRTHFELVRARPLRKKRTSKVHPA